MHPPKVQDSEVKAVIRALTAGDTLPSGAAVREALHDRYGSRGGVTRIYRLLTDERRRLTPPPAPGSIEMLQAELKAMQGRAERAEERESSHQTRWAMEIDQLRQKLTALEPLAHHARIDREMNERLRLQLQAAERRASLLEQQLIEIQALPQERESNSDDR
jgi:hypothetical protein